MLDRVLDRIRKTQQQPEVIAERCVYALLEQASCRACVDSCPHEAWLLDDESLGLDTDACDGCGLCVAACPEEAIFHEYSARISGGSAFAACAQAGIKTDDGLIPCLHALGLNDLLRLYRQGVRDLITSSGSCDSCDHGRKLTLDTTIKALNNMLRQRGLAELHWQRHSPTQWQDLFTTADKPLAGPRMSRRHFLRKTLADGAEHSLQASSLQSAEHNTFVPPGCLLPRTTLNDMVPFVPQIDASRCSGCDACTRLCPHAAIVLERDHVNPRYRLEVENCTGCGICIDGCEAKAITVKYWQTQSQTEVSLTENHCRACGVPFHLPAEQDASNNICPVCRRVNHNRKLYQVLD